MTLQEARMLVNEVNGLENPKEYGSVDRSVQVDWSDSRLARITRLRLLSDPGLGFWDVSYCHGELKDGTPCRVIVGFSQLPKRGRMAAIVAAAKRDGVYAKGLGLFDPSVISSLV